LAAWLAAPPATRPAQEQSLVEPFGEQVLAWHAQGVEGQAIWQLLVEQHGFGGSYSSIKRFLRRMAPPTPRATLRLEYRRCERLHDKCRSKRSQVPSERRSARPRARRLWRCLRRGGGGVISQKGSPRGFSKPFHHPEVRRAFSAYDITGTRSNSFPHGRRPRIGQRAAVVTHAPWRVRAHPWG